jgi:thiamine biosynthesis lipoprotein
MKDIRLMMGMPITVEIADEDARSSSIDDVFNYFQYVDEKFSTYKETSEISAINQCRIKEENYSKDMRIILALSEETKKLTDGYFDIITPGGKCDPSGIVKGWAIYNASQILKSQGYENYYIEAGGDIQTHGKNSEGKEWNVGVRNPLEPAKNEIIKIIYGEDLAVATSGTYLRGQHIYNPKNKDIILDDIVSLTVIGPNIYEADRFATAAFAMGKNGIMFIENLEGFEGYMINSNGIAVETTVFEKYTKNSF